MNQFIFSDIRSFFPLIITHVTKEPENDQDTFASEEVGEAVSDTSRPIFVSLSSNAYFMLTKPVRQNPPRVRNSVLHGFGLCLLWVSVPYILRLWPKGQSGYVVISCPSFICADFG